jgi:16S rRNA C967 or C1407 C5-methylase (RsmB/RsmF family)/NOL1/NOP2/fmu family ribosome biogenesis protein
MGRNEDGATALPSEFVSRMAGLLGPELPAFLKALEAPAAGLRVNSLRVDPGNFERRSPFTIERLDFPPGGYLVNPGDRPGRHPYHAAGVYYLQDPGAMAVGALVDARPGDRVLDIAAAPGGKTTHLAALMANEGLLVANDVSRARAKDLVGNVERCGVRCAVVTAEAPERLAEHFGSWFHRVLVDAPCSGESMFHKSAAAREDWSPSAVAGCARRQVDLVRAAGRLVRPGGVLVYSTCTFSREENEETIGAFLDETSDFEPEQMAPVPGAVSGAIVEGSARVRASAMAAHRFWPHRFPGAGHFVVMLRRIDGEVAASRHPAGRRGAAREDLRLPESFLAEVFPGRDLAMDRVILRGRILYELPAGCPDLGGLNVLRPGLALGVAHRRRFEPSHALALAEGNSPARDEAGLRPGDPRVDRYLEGHPIHDPGSPGWVPVTVDGFAIGWGKRVGNVVKNHYPKGLRRPG